MKSLIVLLGGSCLAAMMPLAPLSAKDAEPWTVETSVGARYFVDEPGVEALFAPHPPRAVRVSPDGAHFFVITSHGDLEADLNRGRIEVFDVVQVVGAIRRGQAAKPVAVAERSSANSLPPISAATWTDRSDAITFQSAGEDKFAYAFRAEALDVATGKTSPVVPVQERFRTPPARSDIHEWKDGTAIYSFIEKTQSPAQPEVIAYPVEFPSPKDLNGKTAGIENIRRMKSTYKVMAFRDGAHRTLVSGMRADRAWISPDKRHAVLFVGSFRMPGKDGENGRLIHQDFMVVDLENGALRYVGPSRVQSDKLSSDDVIWTPDSAAIYLAQLDAGEGGEPGPVIWNLADGASTRTASRSRPKTLRWTSPAPLMCYNNRDTKQHACSSIADFQPMEPWRANNGLSLAIDEDLNRPQSLIATLGNRKVSLIGQDNSVKDIEISPSQIVEWQDPAGRTEKAVLTMPARWSRGDAPLPVVFQIYHYMPRVFRPDGPYSSPYAAQALAAKGIAVIGIPLSGFEHPDRMNTGDEGPGLVRSINGFVKVLAERGWVDPDRVGVAGHSRGGYNTLYAATHSDEATIRAAFVSDGYTASYGQAIQEPESTHWANGSANFWQDKQAWLKHAPDFNADALRGGLLLATNSKPTFGHRAYNFAFMGPFKLARRPFEYINIPYGAHPLMRPRERYTSLSTMVDWMAFWLKGDAPRDETLAVRWKALRDDWQRQQAWEEAGHPTSSTPDASFTGE